jgi:hypothetical protein
VRPFADQKPVLGVAALVLGAAAAKGGHGAWAAGGALVVSLLGFVLGHGAAALFARLHRFRDIP